MSERTRIQRKREEATASPSVQSETFQSDPAIPEHTVNEVPSIVQEVLSSAGQPLDSETRAFMEPRFGHDFSQVRIHTNEIASQSAQAVNALAYTVGSDIVFDKGQFAPDANDGKFLLAHELTHVVQQSAGLVTGSPISDPSDTVELAATEAASRVTTGQSQATEVTQISKPQQVRSNSIQRFQAGDTGHGGIETEGLGAAGFSAADVSKIYLGNWMRDFSQFPSFCFPLVELLALGEFGVKVSKDQLGTYVPSEHLDNPAGAGSNEDPLLKGTKDSAKAYDKLSPDQKAAYEDEQTHIAEVQAAEAASGLPEYIELGKYHAKKELANAVNLGKTDDGMMAMGNGLHTIEDYFAHSNFTEVALWNLRNEGAITPEEYNALGFTDLGRETATLGGSDPINVTQPAIITGTYATIYDNIVSLIEQICTEVENGQLTKAFIVGALMEQGIDIPGIAKNLGMTTEELEKFAINNGKQELDKLVDAVGIPRLLAAFPGIATTMHAIIASVKASVEALQKAATALASASDKKLAGPTHSEIAKDSPEHRLYPMARSLAVYVDEKIGEALKTAWEERDKIMSTAQESAPLPAELVESVTNMVDQFVSHPSRNDWWHTPLLDAFKATKK
jgi:hypothetical protein